MPISNQNVDDLNQILQNSNLNQVKTQIEILIENQKQELNQNNQDINQTIDYLRNLKLIQTILQMKSFYPDLIQKLHHDYQYAPWLSIKMAEMTGGWNVTVEKLYKSYITPLKKTIINAASNKNNVTVINEMTKRFDLNQTNFSEIFKGICLIMSTDDQKPKHPEDDKEVYDALNQYDPQFIFDNSKYCLPNLNKENRHNRIQPLKYHKKDTFFENDEKEIYGLIEQGWAGLIKLKQLEMYGITVALHEYYNHMDIKSNYNLMTLKSLIDNHYLNAQQIQQVFDIYRPYLKMPKFEIHQYKNDRSPQIYYAGFLNYARLLSSKKITKYFQKISKTINSKGGLPHHEKKET